MYIHIQCIMFAYTILQDNKIIILTQKLWQNCALLKHKPRRALSRQHKATNNLQLSAVTTHHN